MQARNPSKDKPLKLLLFLGCVMTGSIDPAPKLKVGAFGTHRPMSYAATFWVIAIIAIVAIRLITFPLGTAY
jgi:hypothetical protein